jgi:hypothetical protein
MSLLKGRVHILLDVNDATTIVLEEIIKLFCKLHEGHTDFFSGGGQVLVLLVESLGDYVIGYINDSLWALQISNIL